MKTNIPEKPNLRVLWGPCNHADANHIAAVNPYGLIAELTAFQPKALTEGELLALRQRYPAMPIYGCFEGTAVNQMLYYADKGMIDGIICRNPAPRTQLRITETCRQPLFLYRGALREQEIKSFNRATADGFFFATAPPRKNLKELQKPCIFPEGKPYAYLLYEPERNDE